MLRRYAYSTEWLFLTVRIEDILVPVYRMIIRCDVLHIVFSLTGVLVGFLFSLLLGWLSVCGSMDILSYDVCESEQRQICQVTTA